MWRQPVLWILLENSTELYRNINSNATVAGNPNEGSGLLNRCCYWHQIQCLGGLVDPVYIDGSSLWNPMEIPQSRLEEYILPIRPVLRVLSPLATGANRATGSNMEGFGSFYSRFGSICRPWKIDRVYRIDSNPMESPLF